MKRILIALLVAAGVSGALAPSILSQAPAAKPGAYLLYSGGLLGHLDPCG